MLSCKESYQSENHLRVILSTALLPDCQRRNYTRMPAQARYCERSPGTESSHSITRPSSAS
jgi:hypothetical protein